MRTRFLSTTIAVAVSLTTMRSAFADAPADPNDVDNPGATPVSPVDVAPPTPPSPVLAPGEVGTTTSTTSTTTGDAPTANQSEHPTAGYEGQFYLRSADDSFLLMAGGRLQVDSYGFAGPGVADYQRANGTGLKANMRLSRLRVELSGRIRQHWFFWLAAEAAGNQQLDGAQKPSSSSLGAADAFVGYDACSWFSIRFGQFDAPFTMENMTSDKWLSFMERSLTARAVGFPANKDLGVMVTGKTTKEHAEWMLSYMGGDGQNRPSVDSRGDAIGRILVRPFASAEGSLVQRMHVGMSGRWGKRDPAYVRYDASTMSTPGGYAFWSPVYGSGASETHVLPSGIQRAIDVELFLPLGRFDLQAEGLMVHDERRESLALGSGPGGIAPNIERAGTLSGITYYVQLAFWPCGVPRIAGEPGRYPDPKIKWGDSTIGKYGWQLVARWEQMFLKYDSVSRSGFDDATGTLPVGVKVGGLDAATNDLHVNVFQFGSTYWATKHVRVTWMWSMYMFPGGATDNQALAPGAKGTAKDGDARVLHEFSARLALAL